MIAYEQNRTERAMMERARVEQELRERDRDRRKMEIRAREEHAFLIERERLAREAHEERESRERRAQEQERERERQRQILEKKRQEQAVHKHFEESLRLAQNKVRVLLGDKSPFKRISVVSSKLEFDHTFYHSNRFGKLKTTYQSSPW
jgi:hypothetical protein